MPIVDYASGAPLFTDLVLDSESSYTSPLNAYQTWASELEVSDTGSDVEFDNVDDNASYITLPFPPGNPDAHAGLGFGSESHVGIYYAEPTDTSYSAYGSISSGEAQSSRTDLTASKPSVMFSVRPSSSDLRTYDFRLRTADDFVILFAEFGQYNNRSSNNFTVAYKIGRKTVEIVVAPNGSSVNVDYFGFDQTDDMSLGLVYGERVAEGITSLAAFYTLTPIDAYLSLFSPLSSIALFGGVVDQVDIELSAPPAIYSVAIQVDNTNKVPAEVSDSATFNVLTYLGLEYDDEMSDAFRVLTQPNYSSGAFAAETINATAVAERLPRLARAADDAFRSVDTLATRLNYSLSLVEAPRIADFIRVGFPAINSDTVGVADVAAGVRAIVVLERLGLAGVVSAPTKYGLTATETVRLSDALRRFFGGDVFETLGVARVVTQFYRLPRNATDTVGLQDVETPKLLFRVTASEQVGLDDIDVLKWLFKPTVIEGLQITAAYLDPSSTFTTWAINTSTGAVSEYENYTFNSFSKFGNKYLGASNTGLYELNGETDGDEDIVATVKSGLMQLGNSRFTAFKDAYLGIRGEGQFVLRLETGSGQTYNYSLTSNSMRSTKVPLGKGLRARYFSFELISDGADFDMDAIEFIPLVSHRRV
jgi:hypothetical protein